VLSISFLLPLSSAAESVASCAPGTGIDWNRTYLSNLTPLTDLGTGTYLGSQGGLYRGGSNTRPAAHESAGLSIAKSIQPLNSSGAVDTVNGKYVFVSIGMSNTTLEFSKFKPLADADTAKDSKLVIVDGAQGGQQASKWANPTENAWSVLNSRLTVAGVTPAQVSVAWIKVANGFPNGTFPTGDAPLLKTYLTDIVRNLKDKYPNIKMAYISSRIYAGYTTTTQQPEPYAFEEGFGVKWLIEDQINGVSTLNYDSAKGVVEAPWLSWGPYLWANGLGSDGIVGGIGGRSDGLEWICSDYVRTDGQPTDAIHPGEEGKTKVANMLLTFFKTDSTAKEWFLANPGTPASDFSISATPASASVTVSAYGATGNANPQSVGASATAVDTNKFTIGDRVETTARLRVRSCADTSCIIPGSQNTGALGTVKGGPRVADGITWWNIDYDSSPDGWSAENWLMKNL